MPIDYRSLLFTPWHRTGMIESAFDSRADAVILDMEDGIPQIIENRPERLSNTFSPSTSRPSVTRNCSLASTTRIVISRDCRTAVRSPHGYVVPKSATG